MSLHVAEQLALGRPSIVEVDAFYLPDTAGTSYRAEHVKTSIGIQAHRPGRPAARLLPQRGLLRAGGEDFAGVFRLEGHLTNPEYLPPYVEVAKLGTRPLPAGRALRRRLARAASGAPGAPAGLDNPFRRYAARFERDLEWLADEPLSCFHDYAFATLRQCGAAFELAGAYLRWLEAGGECGLERATEGCELIATTAKALQFKTARAVSTRRSFDAGADAGDDGRSLGRDDDGADGSLRLADARR